MSKHMNYCGAFSEKSSSRKSGSFEGALRESGGLSIIIQLDRVIDISDKDRQIGAIQKIITGDQE